mgnify:CR=1 FL=1
MLDYTDQDLMDAAQRTVNVYAKIANKELGANIPIPVPLQFDLCNTDPKTAGIAHSDMRIKVNMVLLREYPREMLNVVLPHEVSHLAQMSKYDRRGFATQSHGVEWQEIMRRLGKDPQKYHNFDVTNAVEHHKQYKKEQKAAQRAREKAFKDQLDDE